MYTSLTYIYYVAKVTCSLLWAQQNGTKGMEASTSDCEQYTWPLDGVDVLKYQFVSALALQVYICQSRDFRQKFLCSDTANHAVHVMALAVMYQIINVYLSDNTI